MAVSAAPVPETEAKRAAYGGAASTRHSPGHLAEPSAEEVGPDGYSKLALLTIQHRTLAPYRSATVSPENARDIARIAGQGATIQDRGCLELPHPCNGTSETRFGRPRAGISGWLRLVRTFWGAHSVRVNSEQG